jgi:hypothetical protein
MTKLLDAITAHNLAYEYLERVSGIYGVWVELSHAMEVFCDQYSKWQGDLIRLHSEGKLPLESFDPNFNVSFPQIADGVGVIKHSARVEDAIGKNSPGGPNRIYLSGMCVVTMFDLWENSYRDRIEGALGLQQDELKLDVMGELRHIRNSFLKHRFTGTERTARNKLLRAFEPNEPIGFSDDEMDNVVNVIREQVRAAVPAPDLGEAEE